MKSVNYNHVIGIPIISAAAAAAANSFERAPKRLLCQPTSDQHYEALPSARKRDSMIIGRVNKIGHRMENFTRSIRQHVRLGARMFQVGGVERVFNQNFRGKEEEKLLKAFQCYLSTTAGPIAGFLFISTHKVAFCSERSIKILSPSGKFHRIRYKVLIPVGKIKLANASENMEKPSQKYIQVVTQDNFEFWFMGFLNHQKTLRCLQQSLNGTHE